MRDAGVYHSHWLHTQLEVGGALTWVRGLNGVSVFLQLVQLNPGSERETSIHQGWASNGHGPPIGGHGMPCPYEKSANGRAMPGDSLTWRDVEPKIGG